MGTAVKVCRVDSRLGAKITAAAGVEFIGLHAPFSLSQERQGEFPRITSWLTRYAPWCQSVLVTRSTQAREIADWCAIVGTSIVQIHAQADFALWHDLKKELRNLRMEMQVVKNVVVTEGQLNGAMRVIDGWAQRAYAILFDSTEEGGSGRTGNWNLAGQLVKRVGHARTFIAGGIGPENALEALRTTGVTGVDAQSSLERQKVAGRHVKDFENVLALRAITQGLELPRLLKAYRYRRQRPKLLWSPTELSQQEAAARMQLLPVSDVDGIQIDCSDGREIPEWPIGATEWALLARERVAEAPLWLHVFSDNEQWIRATYRDVRTGNPHLVGLVLQCPKECDPRRWLKFGRRLEESIDIPTIASFSVGQVERLGEGLGAFLAGVAESGTALQFTLPKNALEEIERLDRLAKLTEPYGIWLQLDRGVTDEILRSLSRKPEAVVMGRGLDIGRADEILRHLS